MKKLLYTLLAGTLFVASSCEDDDATTSGPAVGVEFSADKTRIAPGQTIQFTDQSSNTPTFWIWGFEGADVEDSPLQNPVVTYSDPGTYSVSLSASNSGNQGGLTKENYITVVESLEADFSYNATEIVTGSSVQFSDISAGEAPTSWSQTFEGGTPSTSTSKNPTVAYNNGGVFSVTLEVTNGLETKSVTVANAVKVNDCAILSGTYQVSTLLFDEFTVVHEVEVTLADNGVYDFSDLTGGLYGQIYSAQEDNPGQVLETTCGEFAIVSQPDVVYGGDEFNGGGSMNADGSFTLSWSNFFGDYGVSTFYKKGEYIYADFESNTASIVAGQQVRFFDISVGDGLTYEWSFEGGSPATSTEANPRVTYSSDGSFAVTLTVTDAQGRIATETKSAFIQVEPSSCADLSGSYIAITNGCTGDGDGNCGEGEDFKGMVYEVSFTRSGGNTYTISELTGGAYPILYGTGDVEATIIESSCGVFEIIDQEEPYYFDIFQGSGQLNEDGTITYSWIDTWGDQGITTLFPKEGYRLGKDDAGQRTSGMNKRELFSIIKGKNKGASAFVTRTRDKK